MSDPSPSPLSQSTSALDLTTTEATPTPQPSRRLSKRKPASFRGLVMGNENADTSEQAPKTADPKTSGFQVVRPNGSRSVPATPIAQSSSNVLQKPAPPISNTSASTSSLNVPSTGKREKRVSVLGKLVKKFSIMSKPVSQLMTESSTSDFEEMKTEPEQVSASNRPSERAASVPALSAIDPNLNGKIHPQLENDQRRYTEPIKRVAPPSLPPEIPFIRPSRPLSDIASSTFAFSDSDPVEFAVPSLPINKKEADRLSLDLSYDQMGLGKLTIANPDLPGSKPDTPSRGSASLASIAASQLTAQQEQSDRLDLGPSTPPKMSSSIHAESRASTQNLNAPSTSQPAPSFISWPSVTDSRPSSVHVSLLGENSDGLRTPKRSNSTQKQTDPSLHSTPHVEMLGRNGNQYSEPRAYESNRSRHNSAEPRKSSPEKSHSRRSSPTKQTDRDSGRETRYDQTEPGKSSPEKNYSRRSSPTKQVDRDSGREAQYDQAELPRNSRVPSSRGRRDSQPDEERMRELRSKSSQSQVEPEIRRLSPEKRGRSRVDETYRLVRRESNDDRAGETLATVTSEGHGWEVVEGFNQRSRNGGSSSPEKSTRREAKQERHTRHVSAEQQIGEMLLSFDDEEESGAGPSQPTFDTPYAERPSLSRSSTTRTIPPPPPPKSPKPRRIPSPTKDMVLPKPRISSLDGALPPPPLPPRRRPPPTKSGNVPSRSATSDSSSSRSQTRPTSEYPSSGDTSGLRAREAWDADRLFRGKSSVFDGDVEEYITSAGYGNSHHHHRPHQEDWRERWQDPVPTPPPRNDGHGSGHTSYVVPAPFMTHDAIYAPYRPSRTPIPAFAVEYAQEVRRNPLPDPPRESPAYTAQDAHQTTEYWKHYSGLAATS